MLTKRQNLMETIRGGSPDRFVNQYEAFRLIQNPLGGHNPNPKYGAVSPLLALIWKPWKKGSPPRSSNVGSAWALPSFPPLR